MIEDVVPLNSFIQIGWRLRKGMVVPFVASVSSSLADA
jgi:hypothetical protein